LKVYLQKLGVDLTTYYENATLCGLRKRFVADGYAKGVCSILKGRMAGVGSTYQGRLD